MKAKTIKTSIRWKINDWLKTIEDEEVRDLAAKNVIVTGGCIVSMLTNDRVNDYDVYFRTYECCKRVAEYYVERFKQNPPITFKNCEDMNVAIFVKCEDPKPAVEHFSGDPDLDTPATEGRVQIHVKSAGIASEKGSNEYQYFEGQQDTVGQDYAESVMGDLDAGDDVPADVLTTSAAESKPKYRPVFLSSNAITLSDGIQLVTRFIGEPDVIHKYYDFVHCTCYWSSWDGKLVLPAAALEAILTKELRYVGSLYPLCSIIRIRKFVARGWQINAGQILKMCFQLGKFDLTSIPVLEDQLTGVDAAYFVQILDRLKEKQIEDGTEGQPVDGTYLMTIIDRLF